MANTPVFIITGFLESGKSTFIKEIFNDPEFVENEKILLIICENGIEEIEKSFLDKNNAKLVYVNSKDELTKTYFEEINKKYKPTKVIIEYNGMWQYDTIENIEFPRKWEIAQIITPIDASTFENYIANMKSLLIEQFKNSDLIIFNRCKENTDKLKFRNNIKAVNASANIVFELENGEIDDRPLNLPFDINSDIIEIEDYDFGVWYLDALESPLKYEDKKIKLKGMAVTHPKYPKNVFAFGRNAMTCCSDDISFLGLLCQIKEPVDFTNKEWIEIEGTIKIQFLDREQREIPYIIASNYKLIDKIEDDLVYF